MRRLFLTSVWRRRILAAMLTCAVTCAVTCPPLRADSEIYDRLLQSTGWIIVPQAKGAAAGTCWLADRERKLVATSYHVIGSCPEALVYFPERKEGKLVVQSGYYLRQSAAIRGRVVATDRHRDLALIRLDSVPDSVRELVLAPRSSGPGEDVHSIGNSGCAEGGDIACGTLWRYTRGNVRQIYQEKIETPAGVREVQLLETQSPVNRGDSGGPVVNDKGQLVGVTFFYKTKEQLVSYDVDVREVRRFLESAQAGLDNAAQDKGVAAEKAAEPEFTPVGTWKLTITVKEGKNHPKSSPLLGKGSFTKNGRFVISRENSKKREVREGRYCFLNGVLWLIDEETHALFNLTWVNNDRFSARAGVVELGFERQVKK